MKENHPDKIVLLTVADGPESIEIYTSEDEGVVDWSQTFPAVYLTATLNGASVKLGPFQLRAIYDGLSKYLDDVFVDDNGRVPTAEADEVKYVAGFLFNDQRSSVALIHKLHGPACMVGKWNAIGGRIHRGEPGLPDESSAAAMWREFQEEAGVAVKGWTLFLKLKGPGWVVDFYHAFSSDALAQAHTCESETVKVFHLSHLPEVVPNLCWIIPMALGHEDDHVWVYEVTEKETFAP